MATAHADAGKLRSSYQQLNEPLENNIYGIPIYLKSNGDNGTRHGEVYSIIYHPFAVVRNALATPANWCDIVPLHLNVKACTYRQINGECRLNFYSGRKFYEKADDVYQVNYLYTLISNEEDYFSIRLNAVEGPLDTRDYNITVEAIPLTDSSTFLHFSYSYEQGIVTSLAMSTYFMTLGLGKIGFSVVDEDDGEPVYVTGIRGVIERNSMRYYFAIQSYLDTLNIPMADRFEARLGKWFDLTEKHHEQLYEMNKNEYLEYKRKENQDQRRLQDMVNAAATATHLNTRPVGECLSHGFGSG